MGKLRALAAAGAIAIGASHTVLAADLLPPPPPMAEPAEPEFSGWYLRGDVGVGINTNSKVANVPNPLAQGAPGFVPTAYSLSSATNSMSTFVGLGIGYQFNDWFRADITGEYRGGSSTSAHDELEWNDGGTPPADTVLRNFYRGNRSAFVGLLNGYVDLGNWYGISPFIGAGIGVADNFVTGMTDSGFSSLYAGPGSPGISPTAGYYNDASKTSFAWALMAGLDYSITPNLKLEVGYRYLNYGAASAGAPHCALATPGFSDCVNVLNFARSSSSDIRLGMRWLIGDATPPEPIPTQPLVRKY